MTPVLGPAVLAELAAIAATHGLLRTGIVRLDHVGFAGSRQTLARYLERGYAGEMSFLERSADVRSDPAQMLPDAQSLLVAAVPYRGEDGPIARYARSADYHTIVHERLEVLEAALHDRVPGVQTLVCVDTKPIFERAAAALAGLGFIGKHGCIIVPGLGSWFVLGGLLTTARWIGPDAVDETPEALDAVRWDACGACTRCLDACPTSAFVAPGELDPRRCISYLTIEHRGAIAEELARGIDDRLMGCDVCQSVCPYNAAPDRERRIADAAWIDAPPGPPRSSDPWRLVEIGSATYRAWAKHTAVRRVPRRSMRRNALVVIGNGSGPLTAEQHAKLVRTTGDPDPQIAAAAHRALARRSTEGGACEVAPTAAPGPDDTRDREPDAP